MTPKRAHSTDQSELDCATATAAEAAQSSGETYVLGQPVQGAHPGLRGRLRAREGAGRAQREMARRTALAVLPTRQKSAALR